MKPTNKLTSKIYSLKSPYIIAISGVGGAGKSTLAKMIGEKIDAPVISIDSFMKDGAFDTIYKLWEIMDYSRLEKEVLLPFSKQEKIITYGHFDPKDKSITPREIKNNGKLIIEGVGLFRPEINKYFDFKIWIDCPIEVGIERGKARDRANDGPVDELWEGLWKENDMEYIETFNPQSLADFVHKMS